MGHNACVDFILDIIQFAPNFLLMVTNNRVVSYDGKRSRMPSSLIQLMGRKRSGLNQTFPRILIWHCVLS